MEYIGQAARRVMIELIIKHRMARHYKRLEERLGCMHLNPLVMETISREFRFLEQDLIEQCKAVENGKKEQQQF